MLRTIPYYAILYIVRDMIQMRIRTSKSKNATHYAIIYDITTKENKRTTKIYENLGTLDTIKQRSGDIDPEEWMKNYVEKLNTQVKNDSLPLIIKRRPNKLIAKNKQQTYNGGYLFLQNIYYNLGLDKICEKIDDKYQYKYDLNNILSNLIYSRIIYPASKHKTLRLAKNFIEQPTFEYQQMLRALQVINKENDYIQSQLYKNTKEKYERNNTILYYDCTNFYFEITEEDDLRKYGKGKDKRSKPLVGLGLFLDGDGLPLAHSVFPGNRNEQITLKPLEQKIINDFDTSKFIVCTDAGLASKTNRLFNNTNNRRFITTQSIKSLKGFLKEWSLDLTKDWKLPGSDKTYDISKLRHEKKLIDFYYDKVFYKERWINEDGLEQKLIVTFSTKYQEYNKKIRNKQIIRAEEIIENRPKSVNKKNENDPKRFIKVTSTTEHGEAATENYYNIDKEVIDKEEQYDGFYAVCTNLDDPPEEIIKINKQRWKIEDTFRVMKSDFDSGTIYLSREDRISAHFMTCFIALLVFRYLEKEIPEDFTSEKIIETLRGFNFKEEDNLGYTPIYERTELTDILHKSFNFRTDYEIITNNKMKKIINQTKKT